MIKIGALVMVGGVVLVLWVVAGARLYWHWNRWPLCSKGSGGRTLARAEPKVFN